MTDIEMIQGVFSILEKTLPMHWEKVVFHAQYGEASYSMEYYVRKTHGKFVHCFDLPGVDESILIADFFSMDKVIDEYRKTLRPKDLWAGMTLTVQSDRNFNVDYAFPNEDGDLEEPDWEGKYLK